MRALLLSTGLLACALVSAGPRVIDDAGRTLELHAPAKRIVTLAPHAAELVVAAGAGAGLAGISAASNVEGVPAGLPVIGGPGALDRERLLALRPDLVIAWQSGNRAADIAWLERIDVPLFISEPRNLRDIERSIRAIGALAGSSERAQLRADTFAARVHAGCPENTPLPVYVEVWHRPRLTLGGDHWINDVLTRAGFRNVFAQVGRNVIALSDEAALAHAGLPRISLIRRFDGSADDHLAGLLSRPGPRLAEAIDILCRRHAHHSGRPDGRPR
ncbi:MAG: ABC transporter substrate-binding protein [Gammaproteobacteria bacterium]|nr:ABC transporter substrate-binding protein [Gammaproteobacteria bacterium]